MTVADQGEGPGGPGTPLFSDQTVARRAKKKILETAPPPPPINSGFGWPPAPPPPPPYLKVWIRY